MKPNFTSFAGMLIIVSLLFLSFTTSAQSTPGGSGSSQSLFSFTTTPTLISGTALAVGAKYKFTNVASGADAYVTIESATGGATVNILDDNNLTKPEAFSPAISVPANSNGLVTFKIEFINGGGNPKTMSTVTATAMDIDGNANLHEVDFIDMGTGSVASYVNPTVEINMVPTGTGYKATNTAGIEYTSVDTAAKQVMFTVTKNSISSFTYAAGANNSAATAATRQKGIYFKGFDYTLRPVPVKYVSFTGTLVNKAVNLGWVTEQELNNDHYEMERSFDGKNFSEIGMILDGFANGAQTAYAFKDNSAALQNQSVAYYRLKQIDKDGKFSYSTILIIRLKNANDVAMVVSPNPFVESITAGVNSENSGTVQLRIVSIEGRTVLKKTVIVSKGYNNIKIDGLGNLSNGVYSASLVMNGQLIASQKIIK